MSFNNISSYRIITICIYITICNFVTFNIVFLCKKKLNLRFFKLRKKIYIDYMKKAIVFWIDKNNIVVFCKLYTDDNQSSKY